MWRRAGHWRGHPGQPPRLHLQRHIPQPLHTSDSRPHRQRQHVHCPVNCTHGHSMVRKVSESKWSHLCQALNNNNNKVGNCEGGDLVPGCLVARTITKGSARTEAAPCSSSSCTRVVEHGPASPLQGPAAPKQPCIALWRISLSVLFRLRMAVKSAPKLSWHRALGPKDLGHCHAPASGPGVKRD